MMAQDCEAHSRPSHQTLGQDQEEERNVGSYPPGSNSKRAKPRHTSNIRGDEKRSSGGLAKDDDSSCCCLHPECPWQWCDAEGGGGGTGSACSSESEPSFFHGPLLSVKQFRDQATGGFRLVVFQGGRRESVAQVLVTRNLDDGNTEYGHVKCIKVRSDFRGQGFGYLLLKEVFATLGRLSVPEIRLEAEEDMCRYNRLVRYYEALGFRQPKGSRVHYLHNNDQLFRKVPMRRPLAPTLPPRARRSNGLAVRGGSFLLVRLQAKTGGFVRSTADGNVSAAAAAARAASASPSSSSSSCSPSAVAPALKSGAESGRSSLGSLRKDTNPGGDSSGGGAAMGEFSVGVGGGGVCGRHGGGAGGKGGVGGGGGGSADHWILMQEGRGIVCFESAAYGKYLCVEPDGKVIADRSWDNSWEQFRLERFSDPQQKQQQRQQRIQDGRSFSPSDDPSDGGGVENGVIERGGAGKSGVGNSVGTSSTGREEVAVLGGLKARDRFLIRTHHGQYLSLDGELGTVSASAKPVLWATDETNAICHCEGAVPWATPAPASRQQVALQAHLRRMRQTQSVSFVSSLRAKYMASFGSRGRFSIKDVLFRLQSCRDPLAISAGVNVSVAGLMVLTAEDIRDEGLPDWMQAIGLVHGLGRILHFLGKETGATPIERECVLGEYSWVVGAPFPDSITCPSYNADNDDALNERYGAPGTRATGMYQPGSGIGGALLCFTGPEYMHMVLSHNRTNIPSQGMDILRLYPLEPWHAGEGYTTLESPADRDVKPAVQQFDAIRRATLTSVTFLDREVNLERAWDHHLCELVNNFFPGELEW